MRYKLPLILTSVIVGLFLLSEVARMLNISLLPYVAVATNLNETHFYWTTLTYALFHGGHLHLLVNALGLWFLLQLLVNIPRWILSTRDLTIILVGSALASSITWLLTTSSGNFMVGISGVVYALLGATTLFQPRAKALLFFVLPLELRHLTPLLFCFDLLMGLTTNSNVAHFAHIGGLLFGLGVTYLYIMPKARANGYAI